MKCETTLPPGGGRRGVAMIIVMVVIVVLGALAGGFAFSMRVETKLAGNASVEPDLEWLGRSGVEVARYLLSQQASGGGGNFTSLNQRWAGGVGVPLDYLSEIDLQNVRLGAGNGVFSIKITDAERKINLNTAPPFVMEKFLFLTGGGGMGVGVGPDAFQDALADWMDPNDDPRINGAETDDYMRLSPPYVAKNGPLDRIEEALMISGMTPELFYGTNALMDLEEASRPSNVDRIFGEFGTFSASMDEVFTTFGSGRVNVNTASAKVLQLLPGIDASIASSIIQTRAGFDGADGTEDDIPFRSPADVAGVAGAHPELVNEMAQLMDVNSSVFEVEVDARMDTYKRTYRALLVRQRSNVQVLYFTWD